MALITAVAIEDARDMELADGGLFGQSYSGRQVIEAAQAQLEQQQGENQTPLPLGEFFCRREDMGEGTLRLILDGDSDVSVAILSGDSEVADVEFCVPFTGGGRSPKVREALLALARAIQADNESDPLERGHPKPAPFGLIKEAYAVAYRSGDTRPFSSDPWEFVPGTLMGQQDAAEAHAQALAYASDEETQFSAVVVGRAGVKPVGDIYWGDKEL